MRERRDLERAQNLREAVAVGEKIEDKDRRWLERYETAQVEQEQGDAEVAMVTEGLDEPSIEGPPADEPSDEDPPSDEPPTGHGDATPG